MSPPTRRDFLKQGLATTAALAAGTAVSSNPARAADDSGGFKYAICNETFFGLKWPQEKIFDFAAECGYKGVEIAPFTLNTDVTKIPAARRAALRRAAEKAGIEILGLHWILSKTTGLHLTTDDRNMRRRTAVYLGELARLCEELGGDIMIFGSPGQRSITEEKNVAISMHQAYRNAAEVLKQAVPALDKTGVTLAMEPLTTWETNFLLTSGDAVRLAKMVDSPKVKMMLDCKAMWGAEIDDIPTLIRRRKDWMAHFHVNDPNLRGPGFGKLDFVPILKTLKEIKYDDWVSVEAFDYYPTPERMTVESLKYLKKCETRA